METGCRRDVVTGSFKETPRELQQRMETAGDQTAAAVHRQHSEHGNDIVTELDRSLESARSRGYGRYEI